MIITGAGGEAFSAGADIADFHKHRSDSVKGRGYNDAVNGLLEALTEMGTPTISMIQGFAAGGGCETAVATDLRNAAEGSRMGIPVARLGITIGHREMRGLVDLVGKGNALYILLSGRLLDAQEALRIGLVNQVVPPEELHDATYKPGPRHRCPRAPVPLREQADPPAGAGQAGPSRPDRTRRTHSHSLNSTPRTTRKATVPSWRSAAPTS